MEKWRDIQVILVQKSACFDEVHHEEIDCDLLVSRFMKLSQRPTDATIKLVLLVPTGFIHLLLTQLIEFHQYHQSITAHHIYYRTSLFSYLIRHEDFH